MEEKKGFTASRLKLNKHGEALFDFISTERVSRTTSFQCRKVIAEEKCFINLAFAFDFKKSIFTWKIAKGRVCLRKHVKQLRMRDWKQLIFLFAKNYANTVRGEENRNGNGRWKKESRKWVVLSHFWYRLGNSHFATDIFAHKLGRKSLSCDKVQSIKWNSFAIHSDRWRLEMLRNTRAWKLFIAVIVLSHTKVKISLFLLTRRSVETTRRPKHHHTDWLSIRLTIASLRCSKYRIRWILFLAPGVQRCRAASTLNHSLGCVSLSDPTRKLHRTKTIMFRFENDN